MRRLDVRLASLGRRALGDRGEAGVGSAVLVRGVVVGHLPLRSG